MSQNYEAWRWAQWGAQCVENLKRHGFDAHFLETADAARNAILSSLDDYRTVGFGGSDTTRRLGLPDAAREAGKTVYDHWLDGLTPEADMQLRLDMGRCDCFICSANAISMTGEIVNVDGVGNRTNATCFGPRKVFIVAGMNKVTPDLHAALRRVKDVAGPQRAKSLGMATPCAETGICADCNSPQRICRITTILHRRPMRTDVSVMLIQERLGF